jgi:hypothetical protein
MTENSTEQLVQEEVDSVSPPIVVDPSATSDHTKSLIRDLMIFIGGVTVLARLIGTRDFSGFAVWVQSSEAYPFLGLLLTGGGLVWRHLSVRRRKAELVTAALSADNSVAVVQGISKYEQGR